MSVYNTKKDDDNDDLLYYQYRGKRTLGPSGFSKYHPED